MASNKELKVWQDLCDAQFRFIQKYPPEDFNLALFQLFSQVGRYDEMIKMLDEYKPNGDLIEK